MPFVQQDPKPFTQSGIERLTPGQFGVYGIFTGTSPVYIGKGDIRERLLAHVRGDNACISRHAPTQYLATVTSNADALEKQLIIEYDPVCNRRVG